MRPGAPMYWVYLLPLAGCLLPGFGCLSLARDGSLAAGSGSLRANGAGLAAQSGKSFEQECLETHNKWRRLHGAPELEFDKKIAQFSQKRASHIAASDGAEFRHPDNLPYGENLAWHSRPTTSCSDLIKLWYDEVSLYDFKLGDFSHETGHFTQLVWRDTQRVGCARATSRGPKGGVTLVCNYDPPGNFLGEARANVLPARTKSPPVSAGRAAAGVQPGAPGSSAGATSPSTSPSTSTTAAAASTRAPDAGTSSTTRRPETRKKKKKTGKKKRTKKPLATSSTTTTTTTSTTTTSTTRAPPKPVEKEKRAGNKKRKLDASTAGGSQKKRTTSTTTTVKPKSSTTSRAPQAT